MTANITQEIQSVVNETVSGLTHQYLTLNAPAVGHVSLTLTGLPADLRIFFANVVEARSDDGAPHRGGAVYTTTSVNLNARERIAIVDFHVNWHEPLKTGVMLIMG